MIKHRAISCLTQFHLISLSDSRKRANMPVTTPTPFSAPTCFDEKGVTCPTSTARTNNTGSLNQQRIVPTSQVELEMSLPGIKMVIDSSKVCFTNLLLASLDNSASVSFYLARNA